MDRALKIFISDDNYDIAVTRDNYPGAEMKITQQIINDLSYILYDLINGAKHCTTNNYKYKEVYNKNNYDEYLKTEWWATIRERAIKHYGDTCCLCGNSNYIQVHHRNYENLLNEGMKDLIVLCKDCHEKFHGIK